MSHVIILPTVGGPWVDANPVTRTVPDNEQALRNLCDYGAERVAAKACDCLAIDCLAGEQEFVRKYMRETHPTVNYAFGTGRDVWNMVMEARSKEIPDGLV